VSERTTICFPLSVVSYQYCYYCQRCDRYANLFYNRAPFGRSFFIYLPPNQIAHRSYEEQTKFSTTKNISGSVLAVGVSQYRKDWKPFGSVHEYFFLRCWSRSFAVGRVYTRRERASDQHSVQ
jgi:hypothetical protein